MTEMLCIHVVQVIFAFIFFYYYFCFISFSVNTHIVVKYLKRNLSTFHVYIFFTLDSFSEEFGDEKNLETIKNSVLIPTKNREERKLWINKYLNWVRKITNERRYDPRRATPVFGLNGCLPLNRRKCEARASGAP